MIAPIRKGTQGRAGDVEHRDNATEGGGQRQDDDERVTEILVVHDHQQVNENGSEQEPDAHIAKGIVHALDLAQYLDRIAGRELLLQPGDSLVDIAGYAAQIAALGIGIDLVNRLNVGLVGIGRHRDAGQCSHIAQHARHRIATRREGCADRRIGQRIERSH
jgi:hypothetical protein